MNILKALKVAELRKKLSIIPAKIIVAIIATIVINWDTNINTVWENAQADPKKFLMHLFIMYGVVSYVYVFIKLMHNWIFGIILSVAVAALVYTQASKLGGQALVIALAIMLIGGPLLDLINLMRYKSLKSEVIRAEEERAEQSYGEGYDDGYRRGIRAGKRIRREVEGRYEDIEERDNPRLEYDDDYDDEYEDGYDYECDDSYDDEYEDGYDEYEDDYEEDHRKMISGSSEDASGFFADCKTPSAIKRRYHDLCKVYHPDAGNGSSEIFYRIKDEYDRLTK